MSNLLDMLSQVLGGNTTQQISHELGANEQATEKAMQAALPTMLEALARNTAKPDGAEALHRALEKDHDGSVLGNLSGYLTNPQSGNGAGILKHLLGSKRETVERSLSKSSGLDEGSTNKLMEMLAPMLMGALGKEQRSGNLDAGALAGYLGKQRQMVEAKAPKELGLIGKMLDSDGDGDVDLGDFIKKGGGLLGSLMKGR